MLGQRNIHIICHLTSVQIFPQQVCDVWCVNRVPD